MMERRRMMPVCTGILFGGLALALGLAPSAPAGTKLVIDDFTASFDTIDGVPNLSGTNVIVMTVVDPIGTATYTNSTKSGIFNIDPYSAELTAEITGTGGSPPAATTIQIDGGGIGILANSTGTSTVMDLSIVYTMNSPANWSQYGPQFFEFSFLQFAGAGTVELTIDSVASGTYPVVPNLDGTALVSIPAGVLDVASNLDSISTVEFNMSYTLPKTDSALDEIQLQVLVNNIIPSPSATLAAAAGLGLLAGRRRRPRL